VIADSAPIVLARLQKTVAPAAQAGKLNFQNSEGVKLNI
jgi:hypothetical protein